MSVFADIGRVVVGILASSVCLTILETIREIWRAFRQTCRIARVSLGRRWKAKVTARQFVRVWWGDFMSSYTYLQFGGIELPHDPRKSIGHRYFG